MSTTISNSLSSTTPPAQLGQAISTIVAAKTLQAARQEGAGVLKLLDGAAAVGKNASQNGLSQGDALVAKATGLGGLLDITA